MASNHLYAVANAWEFALENIPAGYAEITLKADHDKVPFVEITAWDDIPKVRQTLASLFSANTQWTKEFTEYYAKETRVTKLGAKVVIGTSRGNVCKRVETGEMETVEIPDYSNVPKKTVTRPITRWEC